MENKEKLLTNFAVSFIEDHWNEIDLVKTDIVDTKEELINQLKNDYRLCEWIISEVMSWGCKTDYLIKCEVENLIDFPTVWKFNDSYFSIDYTDKYYGFKEVFPKEKTIIYFE